jgi:hypothetical protein
VLVVDSSAVGGTFVMQELSHLLAAVVVTAAVVVLRRARSVEVVA